MKKYTLSIAFRDIRNYLAGKAVGITRDRALLHEVVKCLFCYINYLGKIKPGLSNEKVAQSYNKAFKKIKSRVPDLFRICEEINLDQESISYIHTIFLKVDIEDPHSDPLSELYQAFVGADIRGNEGQFFTPTEAVRWLVEAIAPKRGERIVDPACGAGSFLSFSARYLRAKGVKKREIHSSIFGIEKDEYLSQLAKTHLALTTLSSSNIVCADSIERKTKGNSPIPFELDGQFDIVLANPPFGARIKIGTEESRKKFNLAHRWHFNRTTGRYEKTGNLTANSTPQILFLELCLKLLRNGGRMGIVVPESMIANSTYSYVVQFLIENADLDAVIGMPENLFKTSGKGGTHTKTCLLVATKRQQLTMGKQIFMAEAKWCGHDSRGNLIPHNDLPAILDNFLSSRGDRRYSRLGYRVLQSSITNHILTPRYYNPEPQEELEKLSDSHECISFKTLVEDGAIEIKTGDEVGKLAYGTGSIPFVRTSDISNWEVKLDPKHGVSDEIYNQYKDRQDVREGDILMVRDGTYLIGTCAYISKYDTKIVFQSHLYKIRVNKPEVISPFLLLAALSSKPAIGQIQAKRFTQDIIDSLGNRIYELILPIPKDKKKRDKVERMVRQSINDRVESRELARRAKLEITAL